MRWMRAAVATVTWAALLTATTPVVASAPKIGQPAPDFTAYLLDGKHVSLADLKGQVVVLNLWATWCNPCKAEMPMLDEMQRKLASHGVRIIGVVVQDRIESWRVANVAKILGYSLAMSMTHDSAYPSDNGVPTTYVIDRKGIVRVIQAGSYTRESFAQMIVPLVNEPAG